jgi:N-acyl homoserine lactone hydrolase
MSTATIEVLECGVLRTETRTVIAHGGPDELALPIVAWLVRHERGIVLFDAGLDPALADGQDALGAHAAYFTAELDHGGSVGPRLAANDVDPTGAIDVVVSHCHFDHVGGLCELPNARLVVQRDEWDAALAESNAGYQRHLFDLGHEVLGVDGEHDLLGDGSVVTMPTPGHTCGHQSLRVRTPTGTTILAGDACYFAHTLDDERLPAFGHDLDQQLASLRSLRRRRDAGATVVPGHDPGVVERFRRGTPPSA